jgi:PAS domain S-box-containing protein
MASESVRRAVRPPITVGWRRAALLSTAALLLLAVYGAVRATGGAPNPLVHFAYLAIALAAVSAGWRGGLLAGLAAGTLLGPLMPDSTAASVSALGQWGWALRLAAYVLAGGVIGWFWDRSQRFAAIAQQRAADARAEAVMRASEERLRRTVEAAADGLLVFDAGGRLTLVNAAAERLLGVPQADLLGATYGEVAGHVGIDVHNPPAELAAALAAQQPLPPTLVALRGPDGTQRSVEVSGRPLDAEGPLGSLVVSLHEVTADRALARERAAHLEGLQAAAQAAAGAPSATAAGEALLAQVARSWPVVALAIYLFDAAGTQRLAAWSPAEAGGPIPPLVPTDLADELRALAAQGPLRTDLGRLPGSGAGAALLAERGAHSLLVLPLSDAGALVGTLLAGERGGPEPLSPDEGAYLHGIGGLAAGIVRRAVEDEEAARQRERERIVQVLATPTLLVPHYQPILALTERQVVGYEALARFRLIPVRPPNIWFAEAAAVGLGAELQALAIERARAVAREAGLPLGTFLSVNISPRYLATAPVQAALTRGSLARLVIEVTEEEAVADYAGLRAAMAPYVARGARFAVDDAGAGYASMRHVTELRPAFVKLDAQLIRGLRDDTARQALVHALVSFTTAIGATPIAEGVEEPADLALLARTRQSLLLQGYAIARPGPAWPAIEPAALGSTTARQRRALLPRAAQAGTAVGAGRGVSSARRIAPGAVPQVLSAQVATAGAARRA